MRRFERDAIGEVIGDEIGEVILAKCDWRDVRSERRLVLQISTPDGSSKL